MEILDYLMFRWRPVIAAFVIGLAAIVLIGLRSGGGGYEARSQLLIVPPVSQQADYASDLDRYINTQMTLLKTPGYLRAEVVGTGVTPTQLARSLDYTHTTGSDVVTLEVRSPDAREAVTLVNAAAAGFLTYSRAQESQPVRLKATALATQIKNAEAELTRANATMDHARAAYSAAHPGQPVPLPSILSPRASTDATLATGRLQQLLVLQSSAEVDQATTVNGSRVLTRSVKAFVPPGWGLVTYVAAVIGLLLLVLTAAAVGLVLSTRVLSQSRWIQATDGGGVGRGIRLRRYTLPQRRRTVRRVSAALDAVGASEATTSVLHVPNKTPRLVKRADFLMRDLGDGVRSPREVGSIADLLAHGEGATGPAGVHSSRPAVPASAPVLLLVDLVEAEAEAVRLLSEALQPVRRLVVAVLV